MSDEKRLIIIDSNALLHRSFHALPPLTTKKGEQTGAVYGFLLTLFKAIKDLKPDYIAACFDTPAPTFRHQKFKDYKAQRPKTPEELSQQIPKIKKILERFEIPVFEKDGFEADDLISTITEKAKQGSEIYILTGDLDNLQNVDENVRVYTLGRGIKETVIYDAEKISSRFGIRPDQMVEFKILVGDSSDNIPGILGIGKKTAADLLKEFNSLENIFQKIKEGAAEIPARTKEVLLKSKAQISLSRELVETRKDVPIEFKIQKCQFGGFNKEKAEEILKEFEFNSLIRRLAEFNRTEGGETTSEEKRKTVLKLL